MPKPRDKVACFLKTHQTRFEILHSFSAQNVRDTPSHGGSVLPEVVKQQERLLSYPYFLDVVCNSNKHQTHTATSWHLVFLATR